MKPKILTDIENKIDKDSIINDLTTGGADKVASAETIKTLNTNKSNKINPTTFTGNLLSIDGDDYQCYHIDSLDSITNYPPNATPTAFVEFIPIHSIRKKLRWSSYGSSKKIYECEYTPSIQSLFTEWRDITTRQDLIDNDLIKATASKALYVATTGSDTTGDGTSAKPFATIQRALDNVPKNLGGNTYIINVSSGTYAGFSINSFYNGDLKIKGGNAQSEASLYNINTDITISHCDLRRLDLNTFNVTGFIVAQRSSCVILDAITITNLNKNAMGVIAQYESTVNLMRCIVSNRQYGVVAELGSYVSVWSTSGNGNDIALFAGGTSGTSSIITLNESTITGTTRFAQTYGGVIIENGVPIGSASRSHEHDYINASNGNEATISQGYAYTGGSLYINYRGATNPITDYHFCDGKQTTNANVRAKNFFAGSIPVPTIQSGSSVPSTYIGDNSLYGVHS